ncbi:MAG: GTP-binding protein [Pseudomonadales bacterium]|nr:GTP-binding protein [Pseudomonadales bacterium]
MSLLCAFPFPVTAQEEPPENIRALYINYWQNSQTAYKQQLLAQIEKNNINALVIDIKNEYGQLAYISDIALAEEIGAYKQAYIRDAKPFLKPYKQAGLYLIARIPVFKDDLLARKRPDLAILKADKSLWKDQQHLAWTDPFFDEVRQYHLQIVQSAVTMGFDEVHLDYIRFPGVNGLQFNQPNTQANRVQAISDLLKMLKKELEETGVKLSIATYGYVCWNRNDTYIGHQIQALVPLVDVIAPMLYPSSFQLGIPGHRNSVESPYAIVFKSLKHCAKQANISPSKFRPWLQAFKDYGFDKRVFNKALIQAQIKAADDTNSNGWMLWNPASRYKHFFSPEE